MKKYFVEGKVDVKVSYSMETKLEIELYNEQLKINTFRYSTGKVQGEEFLKGVEFKFNVKAPSENQVRHLVLKRLEDNWKIEDGMKIEEVNLTFINITEIPNDETITAEHRD